MATHASTLAWRIPWREEPGRLQSMGLQRVGQDRATSLSLSGVNKKRKKKRIVSPSYSIWTRKEIKATQIGKE